GGRAPPGGRHSHLARVGAVMTAALSVRDLTFVYPDGHQALFGVNLDIESSEALESALDGFEGTVLAVSHDRAFLGRLDRFVMITDDGAVLGVPDYELALAALSSPDAAATMRLVKTLSTG
ncbi:MAG: hypothetical protein ACKOFF_04970, partial [Acidimicrobiales bacterium]